MTTREGRQQWKSRRKKRGLRLQQIPRARPGTIAEAILLVIPHLREDEIKLLRKKDGATAATQLHPNLGREIRNQFDLEADNTAIYVSEEIDLDEVDVCSMLILEQVWGYFHPDVYCLRCPWKGRMGDLKRVSMTPSTARKGRCPACDTPVVMDKSMHQRLNEPT